MPFYDDFNNFYVHLALDDVEADKLHYLYTVLDIVESAQKDDFNLFIFSFGLKVLDSLLIDDQGNYNKKLFDLLIEE